MEIKFVADCNVGKLARWLRMLGYDTLYFHNIEDGRLMDIALREGRVVLTKDTEMRKRALVTKGQVQLLLLEEDDPKKQLRRVIKTLSLGASAQKFTRCLECNESLAPRTRDEVQDLVPAHVHRTQTDYMQCPSCDRVYWRGTHWERMTEELERLTD
jgi:uncharacterized protein with PIN domain